MAQNSTESFETAAIISAASDGSRDCLTGKSLRLLICCCPYPFSKIFRFAPDPNQFTDSHRPVPQRGGSRSSRTRGGMRWTRAALLTRARTADGEVVWFWRPDAGVKSV